MQIFKWICFIIVCLDTVAYIMEFGTGKRKKGFASFVGMLGGIGARCFVLYGTLTCWLL